MSSPLLFLIFGCAFTATYKYGPIQRLPYLMSSDNTSRRDRTGSPQPVRSAPTTTTGPFMDALGVGSKLSIITAIQNELVGFPYFVLRVVCSWTCTAQLSWVTGGGFSGGAAVVLLSDQSTALALLAGAQTTSGGGSRVRVVAVIHGCHILAHHPCSSISAPSAEDNSDRFRAAVAPVSSAPLKKSSSVGSPADLTLNSNTAASTKFDAADGRQEGYVALMFAFQDLHERVRYIVLERCPASQAAACFANVLVGDEEGVLDEALVGRSSATAQEPAAPFSPDEGTPWERSLDPTASTSDQPTVRSGSCVVSVPLGNWSSIPVAYPEEGATPSSLSAVAVSVSSFRSACLTAVAQRVCTVEGRTEVAPKLEGNGASPTLLRFLFLVDDTRDFSELRTSVLGLEVLWGLSRCRCVYFSADSEVHGALVSSSTSAGAKPGAPSDSPSSTRGAGSATAGSSSSSSGTFAERVESKARVVAVCEGSLVLLKKKSAYPPPLWCYAISWVRIASIVVHSPATTASSGSAGVKKSGEPQGQPQRQPLAERATRVTVLLLPTGSNEEGDALSAAAVDGGGRFAAAAGTTLERVDISFTDASATATASVTSSASLCSHFIDACRRAYHDCVGVPLHVVHAHSGTAVLPTCPFASVFPPGADNEIVYRRYPKLSRTVTALSPSAPCSFRCAECNDLVFNPVLADADRRFSVLSEFLTTHPAVFLLSLEWALRNISSSSRAAHSGFSLYRSADASPTPRTPGGSAAASPRDSVDSLAAWMTSKPRVAATQSAGGTPMLLHLRENLGWDVTGSLASALVRFFAQLPNPLFIVPSSSTALTGGARPSESLSIQSTPPLVMPKGRLTELLAAALEVNSLLAQLHSVTLPSLPMQYAHVHPWKMERLLRDDGVRGDETSAANASAARGSSLQGPQPTILYSICRSVVYETSADLWGFLLGALDSSAPQQRSSSSSSPPGAGKRGATGAASPAAQWAEASSGAATPSKDPRSRAADDDEAAGSLPKDAPRERKRVDEPPGSRVGSSVGVRLFRLIDGLPRDHINAALWRSSLGLVVQQLAACPCYGTVAAALQCLSVMLLDIAVDLVAVSQQQPQGGAAASSLEHTLFHVFAPEGSTQLQRGTTPAAAQHSLLEWLSFVFHASMGSSTAARHGSAVSVVAAPPPAATLALSHLSDSSLSDLMRRAFRVDDELLWRVYRRKPAPPSGTLLLPPSSGGAAAAAAADVACRRSPLRILGEFLLHRGLWTEMMAALCISPCAASWRRAASTRLSSAAVGSTLTSALLHRRSAATQTVRTSAQEIQLLADYLQLRSSIATLPPTSAATSAPQALAAGIAVPHLTPETDDNPESNAALLRRVLDLEGKLQAALIRNGELQDELQVAAAAAQATHLEREAAWRSRLEAHASAAIQAVVTERMHFAREQEAARRLAVVQEESHAWFTMTSNLLLVLLGEGRPA